MLVDDESVALCEAVVTLGNYAVVGQFENLRL